MLDTKQIDFVREKSEMRLSNKQNPDIPNKPLNEVSNRTCTVFQDYEASDTLLSIPAFFPGHPLHYEFHHKINGTGSNPDALS